MGGKAEDGPTGPLWTLRFFDAASGEDRPIATLEADWLGGVSVSPDGQTIVYARTKWISDVMLIENSRRDGKRSPPRRWWS